MAAAGRRRLRIGLDARECTDPWTGMGRYGLEIVRALGERGRHDYVVWLPPGTGRSDVRLGNGVRALAASSPAYSPFEHWTLPREIERERVDVFHALTYSLPLHAGKAATSLTLFDVVPLLFPANYRHRARLYWRHVLPRTIRRAARVVTLSERSREDILLHLAVDPRKVVVLPAGVGPQFRTAVRSESLQALGVRTPYALAHGNQRPHKNLDALRAAFRELRRSGSDLQLVLSGGSRREEEAEGESDLVVHTGRVDDETLVGLYSSASVYVLPSLYEGAGLTPLEAMACGAPCVLADRGALPQIYAGAARFTATDAAAIAAAVASVVRDAELARALRQAGRSLAAARSWEQAAAALEAVLEEAAECRSPP